MWRCRKTPVARWVIRRHGTGISPARILGGVITGTGRVTAFDPPHTLSYKLLTGLPLQDYAAKVRVEPVAEGSLLTWEGSFVPVNVVQAAGGAAALRAALGGFCLSIGRYVSRDDGDDDTSVHEATSED